MAIEDFQSIIQKFEKNIKPLSMVEEKGAEVVPVQPMAAEAVVKSEEAAVAATGKACILPDFRKLVEVLPDSYIGVNSDVKDMVLSIFDSMTC
jgi:hypothetical protein